MICDCSVAGMSHISVLMYPAWPNKGAVIWYLLGPEDYAWSKYIFQRSGETFSWKIFKIITKFIGKSLYNLLPGYRNRASFDSYHTNTVFEVHLIGKRKVRVVVYMCQTYCSWIATNTPYVKRMQKVADIPDSSSYNRNKHDCLRKK